MASSDGGNSKHVMRDHLASQRKPLIYTNIVVLLCGLAITGYTGYLVWLNSNGSSIGMTTVGSLMIVFAIMGIVGAKNETSWLLLTYFYMCVFLISMLLLFSVGVVAFQGAVETYVDHHWEDTSMGRVRSFNCCKTKADAIAYLKRNLDFLGGAGFTAIGVLSYACYCTVRLISVPIVMKNMLVVINFIFMFIGACVAGYAGYVTQNVNLEAGNEWIAFLFLAMGIFLVIYPAAGVYGARTKNRDWLSFYEACNVLMLLLLLCCAVGGFAFAAQLSARYTDANVGAIACQGALFGCTNCSGAVPCIPAVPALAGQYYPCCEYGVGTGWDCSACEGQYIGQKLPYNVTGSATLDPRPCGQCPQWTKRGIELYIETNLGYLSLLSILSIVFLLVGTAGAHILRKSLAGYQCQSI